MDNIQKDHADSYDRVNDFNIDHAAELAVIAEYAAEKAAFDAARQKINDLGEVQAQDISSLEGQADAAKLKMAKTVVKFGKKGKVKATQLGMVTLADELNPTGRRLRLRPDKSVAYSYQPTAPMLKTPGLFSFSSSTQAPVQSPRHGGKSGYQKLFVFYKPAKYGFVSSRTAWRLKGPADVGYSGFVKEMNPL